MWGVSDQQKPPPESFERGKCPCIGGPAHGKTLPRPNPWSFTLPDPKEVAPHEDESKTTYIYRRMARGEIVSILSAAIAKAKGSDNA